MTRPLPKPAAIVLFAAAMVSVAPSAARAQFQGAWLPPARSISFQLAVSYADNDSWFCGSNLGQCTPGSRGYLSDLILREDAQTLSTTATIAITPGPWWSVWAELPIHGLEYTKVFSDGPNGSLTFDSNGVGDLRAGLRAGKTMGPYAVSGGYAVMLPTGDFDISANLIPVGQGTRNHELFAEAGLSLYPVPAYFEIGVLVRLRENFENDFGTIIDWGDELHGRLSAGYRLGTPWLVKTEVVAFKSGDQSVNIPGNPSDQFRSSWELRPGLLWEWGPSGWIDGWVRIPVAGRNTPADVSVGAAATIRFALPGV